MLLAIFIAKCFYGTSRLCCLLNLSGQETVRDLNAFLFVTSIITRAGGHESSFAVGSFLVVSRL